MRNKWELDFRVLIRGLRTEWGTIPSFVYNVKRIKWPRMRCFGYTERMGSEEFVKKVHVSESVDPNSRGRPPWRWRNRVKEYLCERDATSTRGERLDQARRECLDREKWRLFCRDHFLGGHSGGGEVSELLIDR